MRADIHIKNIHKVSKEHSNINGLDIEINRGDIVGLIGPDGSGKTSLLHLLATIQFPDSGDILLDGKSIYSNIEEYKQRVGYMPRNNPLYENMRVVEFIELMANISNIPKYLRPTRIIDILRECNLEIDKNSLIGKLSRGTKRRLGIAQAIINRPDILLLDHPTSGLDPNQANKIKSLIKELSKSCTIIITTNTLDEIIHLCSRIIYLNSGSIIGDINCNELAELESDNEIYKVKLSPVTLERALTELELLPNIERAEIISDNIYLHCKKGKNIEEDIFNICLEHGWYIKNLSKIELSIEEILTHVLNK